MFKNRKILYSEDAGSPQIDPQIQKGTSQNSNAFSGLRGIGQDAPKCERRAKNPESPDPIGEIRSAWNFFLAI